MCLSLETIFTTTFTETLPESVWMKIVYLNVPARIRAWIRLYTETRTMASLPLHRKLTRSREMYPLMELHVPHVRLPIFSQVACSTCMALT